MDSVGGYQVDLVFDFGVAAGFTRTCGEVSEEIESLGQSLWWKHYDVLNDGFEGAFSSVFERNGLVLRDHGVRLAEGFDAVQCGVTKIVDSAREENNRRALLRQWETDNTTAIFAGGEEIPKPLGCFPEVAPTVDVVVESCPQFADRPNGLGVGLGGRSMATPEGLTACADSCEWEAGPLGRLISRFTGELSSFTDLCCGTRGWGTLYADSLVSSLQAYSRFVDADIPWIRTVGEAFRRAGSEGVLKVGTTDQTMGILLSAAPSGGSVLPYDPADPYSVDSWWNGLDPQTQADLQRIQPDQLRNLDGIPPAVRDRLNREYLDKTLAELEAEIATFEAQGSDMPPAAYKLDRLADLQATKQLLDQHANDAPPPSLLLVDTTGLQTKVVVTIGDITTADHVQTFVPGMNTTVRDSLNSYFDDMTNLRSRSTRELGEKRGDESIAGVVWIGYDAPQGDLQLVGPNSVMSTDSAMKGAEALRLFTLGVQAVRDQPANLTLLAHSYGSVLAGLLAQFPDHGATTLVVFGSPGLPDINDPISNPWKALMNLLASESGMGPTALGYTPGEISSVKINFDQENVFHIVNDDDFVDDMGWFGSDWKDLNIVNQLEGSDDGHSYLKDGTDSQLNLARISVGLPGSVKGPAPEHGPELGRKLTTPEFVGNPDLAGRK